MKFRIKDLEKYLNKKLDWEKIASELTMKSFETVYNDGILEVDILPNRYPDAASLIGLAKEVAIIKNLISKELKINNLQSKAKSLNFKVIVNSKLAPYYFGRIILNVENKPSPGWLKEFVEFYGFNSINFLVDLSNFVMIEYGAPLHIFDLDKIKGNIYVRLAKKGEKFISLEGKEYELQGDEIVIADKEKILGLAGIKGSKTAEIDLKTKNIFIEAAVFDPTKIYQTSRKLNLKTEASFRFERKVAPIRALQALNRVSYLINRNLGGDVLRKIFGEKKLRETKIKFNFDKVKKITGLEINKKEILKIFKKLGIKIKNDQLIVPLERLDLQTETDIVEEIIRIYDLNKIKPIYESPLREIFIEEDIVFNNFLRKILTKAGYDEGHNYSFYGEKELQGLYRLNDVMRIENPRESVVDILNPRKSVVEVLNPISENYKYFQSSLIPNLLKSVYLNQFNFKEIKIFEISKVAYKEISVNPRESVAQYNPRKSVLNPRESVVEKYHLGIVYASKLTPEEILKELKGVLNFIASELCLNLKLEEIKNEFLTAGIKIDNVGILGLIKKKILSELDIDLNVGVIELDTNTLKKRSVMKKVFHPWPIFPQIIRDLSFFIDEKIKFSQLKMEIERLKINYLQEIKLIDVYFPQNSEVSNLKSMTIRFIFFHPQRSLTDEDVNLEMRKIEENLKSRYGITIR
ncbi:MAG: phenylalanine--tRNA ligase beta subunit [Candidatus Parcubacteria bacterium]|nr:MAG: phenylalanine--tRNA ligase beta subunit [Candidatus Parcubacteria bacterium]